MSGFADVLRDWMPRAKPKRGERPKQDPDPAYGKPRSMTGFLATLSEEQRKIALAGVEPELLGDPAKAGKQ